MNDYERKLRSEKARLLLSDSVLVEALAGVETDAIEAMIGAKDDDERRKAGDMVKTVRSLKGKLKSWIDDSKALDRQKPGIA